jgi:predicted transposase YdaD
MRTKMQVEDDFLRELNDYEFRIESAEKRAEEEQRLRKEAEQKAEQERREKLQLQSTLVKLLHSQGNSVADISRITGLSVAEIEQILVI